MINKPRLHYLFTVYFNKTASRSERDQLMELLSQSEHDEQLESILSKTWEQFVSDGKPFDDMEGEKMLAFILQKQNRTNIIKSRSSQTLKHRLRVASVVLLFCLITGVSFWLIFTPQTRRIATAPNQSEVRMDTIVPGSNKAVLTLGDGSSISLDSTRLGTLVKQGNVRVVNLNTSTLAYDTGGEKVQAIVYNTLSTFRGGQYNLELSDGTKVWLNASSSILFPTVFNGKERNVTVTGETYFEVAKNASMPFKIKVKDAEVQVLGTHFNLMAYEDEGSFNTTLLEGSVKISKANKNELLSPGQELMIAETGNIKVVEADVEEVMAWKNGWFQFNAFDIEKVMRQVSRWYNVDVVYEGRVPPGHFTGSVSRTNNISQVLAILEAGGVGFKVEGRKVIVSQKSL